MRNTLLVNLEKPLTYRQAKKDNEWQNSMIEKLAVFHNNGIWEYSTLQHGVKSTNRQMGLQN